MYNIRYLGRLLTGAGLDGVEGVDAGAVEVVLGSHLLPWVHLVVALRSK